MGQSELTAKIHELRELRRMADELQEREVKPYVANNPVDYLAPHLSYHRLDQWNI